VGAVVMIVIGQLQIYQSKQIAARYATQFTNCKWWQANSMPRAQPKEPYEGKIKHKPSHGSGKVLKEY